MDRIMEKLNKLSTPATILIASIIFGGFYYASETNKQASIEKQQQIKMEQEKQDQITKEQREQDAKTEKEQKEREAKAEANIAKAEANIAKAEANIRALSNKRSLYECLDAVQKDYSTGFKNECKTRDLKEDCSLPLQIAESLETAMKDQKSDCFKMYPQK